MPKGEPQIDTVLPDGTMKETLAFLHQTMGSPTTITLLKSIGNNNLSTWSFMTESNVCKFLPHSIPTALGHQDRNINKGQSTTPHPTTNDQKQDLKTIDFYATINQPEITSGKINSDQTGRFLIQSSSGNKCTMLIYAYDPDAILVDPLRGITKESILQAYQNIIGPLTKIGFKPILQRLENEALQLLQNEMDKKTSTGKSVTRKS